MFYEVSKEVFDKLPNFVVGVVAVTGINNSKEYPAIEKMLEENSNEVIRYFAESGNKAKNDPCVVPYREALRARGGHARDQQRQKQQQSQQYPWLTHCIHGITLQGSAISMVLVIKL